MPALPAPSRRAHDGAALVLALAVLVTGLLLGRAHLVPGYGVENDFAGSYAPEVANLLAGRPYTYPYHPPGYAALLALLSPLTRDLFLAAKLLAAAAGAGFVLATYALFHRLFDRRIALAAAALLAATVVPFTFLAAADLLGALAFQLALLGMLRSERPGARSALATGLLVAFAFLLRSNGSYLLGAAAVVYLLVNPGREAWGRRWRLVACLCAGFALGVSPWLMHNWRTTGRPMPAGSYVQADPAYRPNAEGVAATPVVGTVKGSGSVAELVAERPLEFARRYLGRVLWFNPPKLASAGLGFPATLFAGAGALLLLAAPTRRRTGYLVACGMGYLVLGLIYMLVRYYLFLFPLLALAAALGAMHPALLTPLARRRLDPVHVGWGIVSLLVGWALVGSLRDARAAIGRDPVHLRDAAAWLRARAQPGTGSGVLVAQPQVPYLAGVPGYQVEGTTGEEIVRQARAVGARWVEYTPAEAARWAPLEALADPAAVPAGLRAAYRDRHGTVLYEVLPDDRPAQGARITTSPSTTVRTARPWRNASPSPPSSAAGSTSQATRSASKPGTRRPLRSATPPATAAAAE